MGWGVLVGLTGFACNGSGESECLGDEECGEQARVTDDDPSPSEDAPTTDDTKDSPLPATRPDGTGTDDEPPDDDSLGTEDAGVPAPADPTALTDDPVSGDPQAPGLPDEPDGPTDGPGTPHAPDGTILVPGRVEAEEYVRFEEQDISNDVNDCREEPVDTAPLPDGSGGCFVGWTQPGEWLEYDLWVQSAASFEVTLFLASMDPGMLQVSIDGEALGRVASPAAGWEQYVSVSLDADVALSAGEHTLRVFFSEGQTNVDYVDFGQLDEPVDSPDEPATPGPGVVPGQLADCADAPDGYQLVWADEFDYDGLPDPARWGYETGGDGWGNNELQYYTDARLENASVGDGVLKVVAIEEDYESNTYTSAKLNSGFGEGNPGTWNEGVFQIRARLPAGLGTWPALWMMPTECTEGWPNCGEIDIMEHVGYDEGVVHGTIHTDAFNHVEGTQNGNDVDVPDATSEFHTYALIWTTERLEWQVDGVVYHAVDRAADWGFAEWPFAEKVWHLMINLAVGGDWGGAQGVNADDYPATFEIDAVCVYQSQ